MIEPMYKIVLLSRVENASKILETLQQFGLTHIESMEHVDTPTELLKKQEEVNHALDILRQIRKNNKQKINQLPFASNNVDEWINDVISKTKKLEKIKEQLLLIDKKIKETGLWGNVNINHIKTLQQHGVYLKLFTVKNNDIKYLHIDFFEQAIEINKTNDETTFLLLKELDLNSLGLTYFIKEIHLPEINKDDLIKNKKELIKEYLTISSWLLSNIRFVRFLRNKQLELKDQIAYIKAFEAAKKNSDEYLLKLIIWIPKKHKKEFDSIMHSLPVINIITMPLSFSEIPVKLNHNAFGKLFIPLTKLFSIPSYSELDPTLFFAPFFTLFFGICGADIGYGLILLLASVGSLFLFNDKSLKEFSKLAIVLAFSLILSGIAFGVFFGKSISQIKWFEPIKHLNVFTDMSDAFSFALFIGFIQMFTGFIIRMINRINMLGWQGAMQPLGFLFILYSLFMYAMMIYGDVFEPAGFAIGSAIKNFTDNHIIHHILLGVGIILVLFFSSLESKILKRPLQGLWNLYNLATGIPTDILSYLRLFALGLSGALLGNAINLVAFMVYTNNLLSAVFTALILIFGHSINFFLVLLSAFVHPLRLTFVEFYKSIDFKGGGKEFIPFNKLTKKIYN